MELSWPSSEGLFEKQLNNLPCSVFNTSKNVATTSRSMPAKKAVQEKRQPQPCRKKLPSKYYTKLYNKIWQEIEDMMEEEKRLSILLDSQSYEQNSPSLRKSQQSVSSCLIQSSQRCQDGTNVIQNRCKGVPLDNGVNQSVSSCLIQNRCKSVPLDCTCKPVYCSCNPIKCTCKPGKIGDSGGNFASCSKEMKGEQTSGSEKQQRLRNINKEGEEAGVSEKNRNKDEEKENRMEEEEEEEYFWCGASLYVFVEEVDCKTRENAREVMDHKVKSNRRHINRMKEYLRMITGDPVQLEEEEGGGGEIEEEIVEKIDVEKWLKQVSPDSQVDAWVSTVVAEDCLDCIFPLPIWKRYEWDSNEVDDSSDYEEERRSSGTQFKTDGSNNAQRSGGKYVINSSAQDSGSSTQNSCGNDVNPSKYASNSKNSNPNVVKIYESSSMGSFCLEISCGEMSTSVENVKCWPSEGDRFSANAQCLQNSLNSSSILPVRKGNFQKKLDKICGKLMKSSERDLGGRFCRSKVDEDGTDSTNFEEKIEESTESRISPGDFTGNQENSSHKSSGLSGKHGDAGSRNPQSDETNKDVVKTNNNLVENLQKKSAKTNKTPAENLQITGEAIPNLLVFEVGSEDAENLKKVLVDNNFREINAQTISKTTENFRNSNGEFFDNSFDMFLDSIDQLTENHRTSVDKSNENSQEKIEKSTQNHRDSVDEIFVDNSSGIVMEKIDKPKENSSEKDVEDNPNAKNMDNTRESLEKSNRNVENSDKVGANFLGKNCENSNREVPKDSVRRVLKKCGDSVGICGNPVRNCKNSARNSVTVHQIEVANTQKTILTGESSGALFVDTPKLHKYRKIAKNEDFAVPCSLLNRSKSVKFSKKLEQNGSGFITRNCRKSEDIQRGITFRKKVKNSLNKNPENCRTPQRKKVDYPQHKNAENCRPPQSKKIDYPQNKNAENSRTPQSGGVGSCRIIDRGETSCESYEPVAGTSRGVDNICKPIAQSVKNCRTGTKNCKSTVENCKTFGHTVKNCVVILEKLEICLDSRNGNRTTCKDIDASCQNSGKKRKSCVLDENLCTNDGKDGENFVKKQCVASEKGNRKLMESSGKKDSQHNPTKMLQSKSRLLVNNVSENVGDGFNGQLKKKLRICIATPKITGTKSLEQIEHEMKVFYGVLEDSNQKQVVCDNVKISNQKQLISDNAGKCNEKQHNICDHSKISDKKQLTSDSVEKSNQKQLTVNRPGTSGENRLISSSKQDCSYSIPSITKDVSTKIVDNSMSITVTSGGVNTNYIRLKDKLAADGNDFSTKNPFNLEVDQTRRVKHPLSLTKRLRKSTSTFTNSNHQLMNESNDSGLDVEIVKRKVKKMFGIITEIRPPLQDDNAKDAIVWNCGRCKKNYNYRQVKFKFPELNLVAQCPKKCTQANGTKHLKGQLMFEFLIQSILDGKMYSFLLANNEAESFFGCSAFAYWSRDTVRVELRQCIERLMIGRQKGLISNFFVDENSIDDQGRQFIVNVVRMREKS